MTTNDQGKLEAIWLKRFKNGPMDRKDSATMLEGRGIEGNANQGGKRQVTIMAKEDWDQLMSELGASKDPTSRRANLMVSGVALEETRGRVLAIGDVRILVHGETRPCERMDETHPGLKSAMGSAWRGGVFGEVMNDGTIQVGDTVEWRES